MNPIRRLRVEKGLTQAQMAMSLGVSVTTIGHLELGRPANIPFKVLRALSKAGHQVDGLEQAYREWRQSLSHGVETGLAGCSSAEMSGTALNPLLRLRIESGLSRTEMALRLGVGYHNVMSVELGQPKVIPEMLLQALEAAGYDAPALQREYVQWRTMEIAEAMPEAK